MVGIKLPRAWGLRMENLARQAEKGYTATISQLISLSSDTDQALDDGSLQTPQWILLKFNCSSLLINLGSDRGNREAVLRGYECAEAAMMEAGDSEMKPGLEYNIANGLSALIGMVGFTSICLADAFYPATSRTHALKRREHHRR